MIRYVPAVLPRSIQTLDSIFTMVRWPVGSRALSVYVVMWIWPTSNREFEWPRPGGVPAICQISVFHPRPIFLDWKTRRTRTRDSF